jgi:hypothetical protein
LDLYWKLKGNKRKDVMKVGVVEKPGVGHHQV